MKQDLILAAEAALVGPSSIIPTAPPLEKIESSIECFDPLQADYAKETTTSSILNGTSTAVTSTAPTTTHTVANSGTGVGTSGLTSAEQLRLRKKPQNILNRSDSTGSTSGRKFLAPTLSDPQAIRSDKYSQKKKSVSAMASGASSSGMGTSSACASTSTRGQILSSSSSSGAGLSTIASSGLSASATVPAASFAGTTGTVTTLPPLPHDAVAHHSGIQPSQSHHHGQGFLAFDLQQPSPVVEGTSTGRGLASNSSSGNYILHSYHLHSMNEF